MAWSEADIINALTRAGTKGLTAIALAKDLSAARGSKQLSSTLTDLKARGAVRGPFRIGRSALYFDAKSAPSREQSESRIEELLRRAGTRLTNLAALEAGTKGTPKALFRDALSSLKAEGRIVELRAPNRSLLYVHRESILDQLRLGNAADVGRNDRAPISLEDVRPAYLMLKAEQGGISAVKIYDVLRALGVSKDELHGLLLREAQRGRVTLHAASTVNFPPEVMEAGIKIDGEPNPYVTFILQEAP